MKLKQMAQYGVVSFCIGTSVFAGFTEETISPTSCLIKKGNQALTAQNETDEKGLILKKLNLRLQA